MMSTEVQDMVGKGKGTVATRAITASELVMEEEPLVKAPMPNTEDPHFAARVAAHMKTVDKAVLDAFMDLVCPFPETTSHGIWQVNHFNVDGNDIVYRNISRINHSCTPNCAHAFDRTTQKGQIRALRDIPAGQEITITYCDLLASSSQRKHHLNYYYKFPCACDACLNPGDLSDTRRAKLSDCLHMMNPLVDKFRNVHHNGQTSDQALREAVEARQIGVKMAGMIIRLVDSEGLVAVSDRVHHACDAATFLLIGHPTYQKRWADECVRRLGLGGCASEVEEMRECLESAMKTPLLLMPAIPDNDLRKIAVTGKYPNESIVDKPLFEMVDALNEEARELCMPP